MHEKNSSFIRSMFEWLRYGLASTAMYGFVFAGTYAVTEFLGVPANWSYGITITAAYVTNYFLNLSFVFNQRHAVSRVWRFAIYTFVFWGLNNLFFNALFVLTGLHYLAIVLLGIVIFMPMRFFSLKYLVFKHDLHQEETRI